MNAGFVAGAFGLGATLAILPGPVQFVLLTDKETGEVTANIDNILLTY